MLGNIGTSVLRVVLSTDLHVTDKVFTTEVLSTATIAGVPEASVLWSMRQVLNIGYLSACLSPASFKWLQGSTTVMP